jgi:hypothetical protein
MQLPAISLRNRMEIVILSQIRKKITDLAEYEYERRVDRWARIGTKRTGS